MPNAEVTVTLMRNLIEEFFGPVIEQQLKLTQKCYGDLQRIHERLNDIEHRLGQDPLGDIKKEADALERRLKALRNA
jgi:archaellum component FlaC